MVAYVKYNMCKNHENTSKFEETVTLYFREPDMMVLGNIIRV